MLERARELMCEVYVAYGLNEASLRASELVDELIILEIYRRGYGFKNN